MPIRQDREHAKRDIDSQITQLTIAIKTCHSVIQGYRDDIEDLEREREAAESALSSARNQTRFQGSGVSRDKGNESAISRIEKNIAEIDAVIQNRRDLIKIQEETGCRDDRAASIICEPCAAALIEGSE